MTSRANPDARRVGHYQPGRRQRSPLGSALAVAAQHRRHVAPVYPRPGPLAQVVPGVPDRGRRPPRCRPPSRPARPPGPALRRTGPAPQYRSSATSPGCGPSADSDGLGQRVGGAGMHLPEHARADPPVPPGRPMAEVGTAAYRGQAVTGPAEHGIRRSGVREDRRAGTPRSRGVPEGRLPGLALPRVMITARSPDPVATTASTEAVRRPAHGREAEIGDGGMGDRALADVDHFVRAVRAQAGHPVRPHRELHPRPPAQAWTRRLCPGILLVSGQCLDRDLAVEAG